MVGGDGEMIATRPDGTRVRQTLKQAIVIDIVVFTTILDYSKQPQEISRSLKQSFALGFLYCF